MTSRNGWGATIGAMALMLALAACGGGDKDKDAEAIDRELAGLGNDADPALTGALGDQIQVDPARAGKGGAQGAGGLRSAPPPSTRADSDVTLGELAELQSANGGPAKDCTKNLSMDTAWAGRLPAGMALIGGATVSEAAGNDEPGCRYRVVSFASGRPLRHVIDWYYTKVTNAGFSAEHALRKGDNVLAGTRARDGSVYYLMLREAAGGTEGDLIVNSGS